MRTTGEQVPVAERRYVLRMFFALAYGITWLFYLPLALSAAGVGWWAYDPPGSVYYLLIILGSFGPAAAGLSTLAATTGAAGVKELLRGCVRWRVPVVWYLVAVAGVLILPTIVTFAVPGASAHFAFSSVVLVTIVINLVTFQLFVGALGEEPGWRGFALPRMQLRYGPLVASLLLGVIWAGWHAPLLLLPDWVDNKGGMTVWTVAQYVLMVVALSVLMAWIYNQARGSVLLVILFHAATNTSFTAMVLLFDGSETAEGRILLPALIGFGAAALVVIAATRGRLGLRRP